MFYVQIQYLGAFIGSIATEPINAVKVDAAVKQRQHPLCLTQVVISLVLKLFNTKYYWDNHLHLKEIYTLGLNKDEIDKLS